MSTLPSPATRRSRLKADRRMQLIMAAEQLIADRGFLAVRLEDIGNAVGVSGPAIYRHFPNKEALLVELLVGISTRLLAGGQNVVAGSSGPAAALDALIEFHLDFTLGEPDLIRIQDRDLGHLPTAAQRQVRKAQRAYVEIWVGILHQIDAELSETDARLMAHAAFGLLNSTPHSTKQIQGRPTGRVGSRAILRAMTVAALTSAGRVDRRG